MNWQPIINIATTVIVTLLASSGFWAFVEFKMRSRDDEKDQASLQLELLKGMAHDRIMFLGMEYIGQGEITSDQYENLCSFLYEPYVALGGNGSVERIMTEIKKLKIVRTIS